MACYGGKPHQWEEMRQLSTRKWIRLFCLGCGVKKWKERW